MTGLPDWSPRHFGSWGRDDPDPPPARGLVSALSRPGRVLDAGELLVLLGAMVEEPPLWRALADLERTGADEVVLQAGPDVEVRVLRWTGREKASGWHDHDRSASAVRVLLGALVEHTLGNGDERQEGGVRIGAGTSYPYEPEHVHRLDAVVDGTLSLHAWSPPLERTGLYEIDEAGRLRRAAVDL